MNYETRMILARLEGLLSNSNGRTVSRYELALLARDIRSGEVIKPQANTVTVNNLSRPCGK